MSITYKDPNNTLLTGGVEPDTKLWFYRGSWFDPTYENALWFSKQKGTQSQWSWFDSNFITGLSTTYTYAIKSAYEVDFRVPWSTDDLFECSYICRVKNHNESNEKRWFYFINSVTAYSPNMSIVHCTLDVIQTFMFEWKLGNQSVLRCNGLYSQSIRNDPRCFTNEDISPAFEECSHSEKIDPLLSTTDYANVPFVTDAGFDRHALTSQVFLLVATEYFDYGHYVLVGGDPSVGFRSVSTEVRSSGNDRDANQFFYCVFKTAYDLQKYLIPYGTENKMNAIKGIYGIPLICAGQKATETGATPTDPWAIELKDILGNYVGWRIKSVPNKVTVKVDFRSSFYGYAPLVNKTRTTNCIAIETRSGKQCIVKANEINWDSSNQLTLSIVGIVSTTPKVMVIPHTIPETDPMKTSNYLSTSICPMFAVYDESEVQIYNAQYQSAMSKEGLGMLMSVIAIALGTASAMGTGGASIPATLGIIGGMGGVARGAVTMRNMEETYKPPQNMVGTSDESDIWLLNLGYVMVRWLSPTQQNLMAFDKYLAMYGYNYSGETEDLGLPSGDNIGKGVYFFGRKCFCYYQLANCKIVSGSLGIYKTKVENIFNTGIRFWNVYDEKVAESGICNFSSTILARNES